MRSLRSGLLLGFLAAVPFLACATSSESQTAQPTASTGAQPSADPQADKPCMFDRVSGTWQRCLLLVGSGSAGRCAEWGDRCTKGK